jgi:hypothetical protein
VESRTIFGRHELVSERALSAEGTSKRGAKVRVGKTVNSRDQTG